MQPTDMNWVQSGKMLAEFTKKNVDLDTWDINQMYDEAAEKIKIRTTNLPEGMRTPTADEIKKIEAFGKEYRSKYPKASSREIRRATQRKFNIQILPNTKDQ